MATIHDEYFSWLFRKVDSGRGYAKLSSYLHNRWEFYWSVDYDENRQADGYDQRDYFLSDVGREQFTSRDIRALLNEPVSVFEVIVALCDRIEFQLGDSVSDDRMHIWYDELISNLELDKFTDDSFSDEGYKRREIDDIIQVLLDRTYDDDGTGSLFPLQPSHVTLQSVTEVELWYQMMNYLEGR